ncbi:methyltransferase family protein [Sporosalibacterium faouarense]|uniref:methyltransferase family protein n=1 Tax=Sporosalibacterium faouarense TaxID=516123 RepID=UPI00141CF8F6|nr:isoprenylcysteine carboxylmethyltransferase family protein [Sporosalibacterium faouarense]MTI46325.1 isoprenylcysteine carboxylmethyltransferase family protein [Bacillota bacterium]
MQETLQEHFHQWGGVLFFIILYSILLLFIPFYKKANRKPTTAYMAFVLAFAIEMHGIPMSMYFISWIIGRKLPNGILWGHTLNQYIGYWGMYLGIGCAILSIILVANGWYNIYHKYWSREKGEGRVVKTGIYRYIRHPQYTGFVLMTIAMMMIWATLSMIIIWPIMVYTYYRLAKKEERDMVMEFGEEYIRYMKKTKMFIPYII